MKQIYQKRWSLRQHLLHLKREKESVTYLDGGSRGKPRSQWDTSIDDVRTRHARTLQHIPSSKVSKSDESLYHKGNKYESQITQSVAKGLPEHIKARLAAFGLYAVASEENLPLRISGRPITMESRSHSKQNIARLPDIQDNQRISSTRSDLSFAMKRPKLRHSNATLQQFPLERRRLSRSLTDLEDFHKMSKTLQSAI